MAEMSTASLMPTSEVEQVGDDSALSSLERMSAIEEPCGGSGDCIGSAEAFLCQICNKRYRQPRVLQCLHVFCTPCLEKLTGEDIDGEGDTTEMLTARRSISCPACQQETRIESSVSELPLDIVTMNAMDAADIRALRMQCTSCKADERAVARCSDCASFLCSNCVTAHKYMRLFENHKVESFDDLQKGDGASIHKPFFCSIHPVENVKFFCSTCQIPVCSECMLCVHKPPDHVCDRITDIEAKQVDELNNIISVTRSKINACETASVNLESVLSDLQQQRDAAHDLILETFHSYKAVLEERRDVMLKELDRIHTAGELAIMDMYHTVERAIDQMDTACRFTDQVLAHGNGVEILSMKKHIAGQLLSLINGVPCLESSTTIVFESDADAFVRAITTTFGHFVKAGADKSVDNVSTGRPFPLPAPSISASGAITADYLTHSPVSPEMVAMLASGRHSRQTAMNSFQVLMERSLSAHTLSSVTSPHGIDLDGLDHTSVSRGTPSSLHLNALAKLGVSMSGQGLAGHPITGVNINNSAAALVRAGLGHRMAATGCSAADNVALAGLLNTVMMAPGSPSVSSPSELGIRAAVPPSPLISHGAGVTTGSPISASIVAANLLSSPPLSIPLNEGRVSSGMSFGIADDTGVVRARNSGKVSAMQIRCKFGQLGPGKCQFNSPHGFCLGMDEDIVVADTNNHRVQVFEKTGEFKYQFGIPGREEGQLWYPRKVAVIRSSGKYVVCDRGNERSRMQIFTKSGQFIKKIAIRYIDIVAGLAITSQGHIVAVDSVSPTVFCISETGDLIRWFDCSDYMREPSDIAISGKEYFVCDFKGHCVVVFNEDGQFLHRIGCENITNYPNGIDISDAGDVLIGDSHGNRFHIAVFQRDGSLIGEFECPYVKVSRCCGLKITSEGYVVTLAKNNQHVLVLNTLYIA